MSTTSLLMKQGSAMNVKRPNAFLVDACSDRLFFNSKELQEYDPVFYYGCKTKPRNILQKKNIPVTDYLYANFNARNGAWMLSTDECKKAQLLISKIWVETNMRSMRECIEKALDEPTIAVADTIPPVDVTIPPVPIVSGGGSEGHVEENEYEEAPPLVELDEHEKFRDAHGNIVDIETVCKDPKNRTEINTFFRCSDVSKAFDMPNLNKNITASHTEYEENTDYKYFKEGRSHNMGAPPNKNANPFYLYLTYEGLLRVLFVSRNKHATPFRKWATAILFTHQMGTKEAKIKLGTDLLNITPKTYKAVFDSYASTFPCIYLLRLGTVGALRNTFGIDATVLDDLSVYKYGFTKDLSQRIKEHASGYGKMHGVAITLSTFHVIDTKYTSDAEGDVREFVETFQKRLNVDGYNELIALTDKETAFVKKQYASIGARYAGATAALTSEIAELKARIKELENELVVQRLHHVNELQKEISIRKRLEMEKEANDKLFQSQGDLFKAQLNEANLRLEIQMMRNNIK